jgi:uncharacterized protein YbdZ (MbtH family)
VTCVVPVGWVMICLNRRSRDCLVSWYISMWTLLRGGDVFGYSCEKPTAA